MSFAEREAMLLVLVTALACAVPGVLLVLRRLALIGDAIGHVLLFGVVGMYYLTGDLDSPWLVVGAVLSGVLTVALVELLERTQIDSDLPQHIDVNRHLRRSGHDVTASSSWNGTSTVPRSLYRGATARHASARS